MTIPGKIPSFLKKYLTPLGNKLGLKKDVNMQDNSIDNLLGISPPSNGKIDWAEGEITYASNNSNEYPDFSTAISNAAGGDTVVLRDGAHTTTGTITIGEKSLRIIFRGTLKPNGDFNVLETPTKADRIKLVSWWENPIIDCSELATYTSNALLINSKVFSDSIIPIAGAGDGGIGVYFQGATGYNSNWSNIKFKIDGFGGDGLKVEDSSGEANMNGMTIKLIEGRNNNVGARILDGHGNSYILKTCSNINQGVILGGGATGISRNYFWVYDDASNGATSQVNTGNFSSHVEGIFNSGYPAGFPVVEGNTINLRSNTETIAQKLENPLADDSSESIELALKNANNTALLQFLGNDVFNLISPDTGEVQVNGKPLFRAITSETTYTIGSTGDYATVYDALNDLEGLLLTASLILELQEDIAETNLIELSGIIPVGANFIIDPNGYTWTLNGGVNSGLMVPTGGKLKIDDQNGAGGKVQAGNGNIGKLLKVMYGGFLQTLRVDLTDDIYTLGTGIVEASGNFQFWYNSTMTANNSTGISVSGGFAQARASIPSWLVQQGGIGIQSDGTIITEQGTSSFT